MELAVLSDCSAGFGLVAHQHARGDWPRLSIDSARDFHELTRLKVKNPTTGLVMIGGGVPKNFAQDIVVAAEVIGFDAPMHKYAVQVTVADVRDGAPSGSTLEEVSSRGKSTRLSSRWSTPRRRWRFPRSSATLITRERGKAAS
jgi:deoxyhypusine synthase